MICKSKLLWDSRWPTLELKLFTSVREILGITLKHDKRFPCWFTCPIQSHNDISYMSYHRLSWFTLSFVEWWVCLRKGYLSSAGLAPLCIQFIASLKVSGTIITYSGYCHPLPPDISTTTQPKISTVCLFISKKGQDVFKSSLWNILKSRRTWDYLL